MHNINDKLDGFTKRVVIPSRLYKQAMALRKVACDETSKHYTAERLGKNPSEVTNTEAMIDWSLHHTKPLPKE